MMPQWNPTTLEEVKNEDIDRVFQPFSPEQELQVPSNDSNRLARTPHTHTPRSIVHGSCWNAGLLTLLASTLYRWSGKYENTVYAKDSQ